MPTYDPSTQRQKQEDCFKLQFSLSYIQDLKARLGYRGRQKLYSPTLLKIFSEISSNFSHL